MPQKLDDCVDKLMSDPKFKSLKDKSKKESAFAVCQTSIKKSSEPMDIYNSMKADDKHPVNIFWTATDLFHAFQGAEPPKEIELMRAGTFHDAMQGDFELTHQDLDKFVESFDRGIRDKGNGKKVDKSLPINLAHNRDGEAAGWIKDLIHDGDGVLKATVEWTKTGLDKIKNKLYKYISPEWHFAYRDPESGMQHTHVIMGAGLTNIPLFKKLKPLTMSEDSVILFSERPNMKLKDLIKKDAKDLDENEVKFLKANEGDLDDDAKKKFADVLNPKKEPKKATEPKTKEPKTGDDKTVTIQASEYNALKGQVDVLSTKVNKNEVESEVDLMIASESNTKGKLLPAHRELATEMLLSYNEDQKANFKKFVASLPEQTGLFEENGDKGKVLTGSQKIDKLAKEAMEKDDKLQYSAAVKKVLGDNPELAKEYGNEGEK